jgi:hypothetical protein
MSVSNKYVHVNYSKNEVEEKVEKIFMNFAQYYKEEKEFLVSQMSLVKILKKLELVDNIRLKLIDVDIIFRKINSHSNKLNKKGLTCSKEPGPPKLNKITAIFFIFLPSQLIFLHSKYHNSCNFSNNIDYNAYVSF